MVSGWERAFGLTLVPQVRLIIADADAPAGTPGAGEAAAKGAGLSNSSVPTAAPTVIRLNVVVLSMSGVTAFSRKHWNNYSVQKASWALVDALRRAGELPGRSGARKKWVGRGNARAVACRRP